MIDVIFLKAILLFLSIVFIFAIHRVWFYSVDILALFKKSKETATGAGLAVLSVGIIVLGILFLMGR